MDARYLQVAADLRRRISDGTWTVGTQLPTLRQLQDDYPDVGASTIRAAVQVLVDEGLVDTRRGVGSFVAEVPAPEDDRVNAALEQLHLVRSAATRALQTLEGHAIRPVRAQVKRPQNPVTEVWGHMRSAYCRTCGEDLGRVTRGWVATEDYYYTHVSWGGHDELEHDIVVTYGGSTHDQAQEEPLLLELWWERYARLERTAVELLAGNQEAAQEQSRRAAQIAAENPAVTRLNLTLAGTRPNELSRQEGSAVCAAQVNDELVWRGNEPNRECRKKAHHVAP